MREKIIVIGGGGHAKVVISILKKLGNYDIIGFTDNKEKESILGIPYIGNDETVRKYYEERVSKVVIGIGQIKEAIIRKKIVSELREVRFQFPSIISHNAIINEDVEIGEGTVVMDGVVINCGTKIGMFSILNTNCSIDHDCVIGNYSHIAPGVTLSGEVNIADDVLIGTGSSIIQGIKIEKNIIVGAGSVVVNDLIEAGTYAGNPARKRK